MTEQNRISSIDLGGFLYRGFGSCGGVIAGCRLHRHPFTAWLLFRWLRYMRYDILLLYSRDHRDTVTVFLGTTQTWDNLNPSYPMTHVALHGYHSYELETLAVVNAVKRFRHYLHR